MKIFFHGRSQPCQILLRIAVDIDNPLLVVLGDGTVGGNEFDRVAEYACGPCLRATADDNIPAGIADGYIAIEIADFAVHFHIGDGGIFHLAISYILFVTRLFRCRQLRIIVNLLLQFRRQGNSARLIPAEGFGVLHRQARSRAVGYAVNLIECGPRFMDIDSVDFIVALSFARRNDIVFIIDNAAALLAHKDVIQLEISIRFVRDGYGGRRVGMEIPRTCQVIGLHIDIATADSDIRDSHIVNRTAGVEILNDIAVFILFYQPQALHFVLYSATLCDICRHFRTIAIIGSNQFIKFPEPTA